MLLLVSFLQSSNQSVMVKVPKNTKKEQHVKFIINCLKLQL